MSAVWASITGRLTLLFALLVLPAFGLAGWAMFERLAAEIAHAQVHAQTAKLEAALAMLERARAGGRVGDHWGTVAQDIAAMQRADRATRYWVFCDEGPGQGCHPDLPALSSLAPGRRGQHLSHAALGLQPLSANSGDKLYAISADLPGLPAGQRVRLVVTQDAAAMRLTLRRFAVEAAAISLLSALVTGLLGWALARHAVQPVRVLSASASSLGPGRLGRRLDTPAHGAELHGLVQAFNAALDRIQAAFAQLETFNANVAHELRTPLNTLIGTTQVALSRPRSAEHLREVLAGNLEDCERLAKLVRDMLFLARADHGQRAAGLQTMALHGLARDTAEFFEPLLEEQGVRLEIHGEAWADVDAGLVKQALSNLVANALQYGAPGSPIDIELRDHGAQGCELLVSNHGPALDPHTLDQMFNRFYRADDARQSAGGHAGLGLAIVQAVARMHGGSVFARCADGQVHVGMQLP